MISVSLTSCNDNDKKPEVDTELFAVEDLAKVIENGFNTYRSDSIKSNFSPVLFSWRLGSDFKTKNTAAERQGFYSAFNMLYKQSIDSYVESVELLDLEVLLFDIHKKDNVYRLNYYVTDQDERVVNYLIFYVDKDRNGDYQVVNFYNVSSGFTYSDMIGEYIDGNNYGSNRSEMIALEKAANKRDVAIYNSSIGKHKEAYEKMKTIDYKYLNSSGFAQYKMIFASKISVSLYKEELEWMSAITHNEVSKKYYECISLTLDIENEAASEKCVMEFEELLISS
ncbi:hypothetical protein [Nonlabens dokdonensis]|jgi:hypothetical protein|uniref:Uncharacterized protein n=2 Tax=Nonlabens dokdonensis TaxID=328515 RepID=L7W5L9_NONDD|nr:hypothetical protein [Nonlabens dokdonensis]AGC75384.1 hypothetical protein DDD_0257 [Nonlabens dokdonensis DSW-6]